MTNSMNAWFPALYLKKEAEKRGLDASDLNTTMAMTMMLKGSPTMNMFLADSGLKRVEAESELSEKRNELQAYSNGMVKFRRMLEAKKPEFGEFIIAVIEFILYNEEKVDTFKEKIRDLMGGDHAEGEFEKIKDWLELSEEEPQ